MSNINNPYLGSRISLISKAKIRYEGILYAIDTDAMTVALTKVRSFGTENRCPDRPIAPRDETFEYIIFRGTDICDLNVCDLPNDRFPQDPAILSATTQPPAPIGQPGYGVQGQSFPQSAQSPKSPPGAPGSDVAEKERHDSTSDRDRRNNNQRNAQNYDNRRTNQNNQRNFQNRNNQNKTGGKTTPATQFKEDFDFETSNAEFENIRKELFENLKISPDKEEATNEDEEPESGEIIEEDSKDHEYYNKANSFFDNISCEATDPHGERITRSAERKLNSETFGITGNNRNYNRRGGYSRGRGGDRNGYHHRGGHRGGYNNRGRGGYNRGDGQGGESRNWRQGHDNRGMENGNNSRGNWKRGNWNQNRGGGRPDNGNWRGGGQNNRGNNRWQNKPRDGATEGQPRQNRNNRNREWVDYEYDVSKARQETQQES